MSCAICSGTKDPAGGGEKVTVRFVSWASWNRGNVLCLGRPDFGAVCLAALSHVSHRQTPFREFKPRIKRTEDCRCGGWRYFACSTGATWALFTKPLVTIRHERPGPGVAHIVVRHFRDVNHVAFIGYEESLSLHHSAELPGEHQHRFTALGVVASGRLRVVRPLALRGAVDHIDHCAVVIHEAVLEVPPFELVVGCVANSTDVNWQPWSVLKISGVPWAVSARSTARTQKLASSVRITRIRSKISRTRWSSFCRALKH